MSGDEAGPTLSRLVVPPDAAAGDDPDEVRKLTFPAGAVIIEAGGSGDASYFVIEGRVRVRRGERVLCRLGPGQCFGELAVLDNRPRAATVEAETDVRVLRVAGARFRRWFAQYPPLEGLLGTMQQAYQRPDGGLVTLHTGTHEGAPCVTSVRALADGRQVVISRLTDRDVMLVSTAGADAPDETLEYDADGARRTLALRDGRAVGFEAHGVLDDSVAQLTGRVVSGRVISDAERARFGWTGSTGVARGASPALCACVGLTRRQAEALVGEGLSADGLRARCGAGSICGSCVPAMRECARPTPARRGLIGRLFGRRRTR